MIEWPRQQSRKTRDPFLRATLRFVVVFSPLMGLVAILSDTGFSQEIQQNRVLVWVGPAALALVVAFVWSVWHQYSELKTVESGDLGDGVRIGGLYREVPLRVLAGAWEQATSSERVRSGWLYSPEHAGTGHAVLFFKIHKDSDGTGYIHLFGSTYRSHKVWVETATGWRKDATFKWREDGSTCSSDRWYFEWKA